MPTYSLKPVFSRGELSPKLHSRADLEHFATGLKECLGWQVMRQGGITRTPGTQFVQEVKDSTRPARFIPFIFSASQAYMLVLNAGVFRVYTLGGRVGTVEVAHPYADGDLFQLDFDQTNDVLDITHKSYVPRRIKRQSDTSWSIALVDFRFGPYLDVNATTTSITPSGTGNAIPPMTSATTPSGVASASSVYTGPGPWDAFYAFDRDSTTWWRSNNTRNGWLSYQFASAAVIVAYSVRNGSTVDVNNPNNASNLNAPKAWSFEGSNNGTTWTIIDSQFAQSNWSAAETREFRITNNTAYLYYRLNVSTNNQGQALEIAEFAMVASAATAVPITLTASSITGINNDAGFDAADVGRSIALLGSDAIYHSYQITAFISTTSVSAIAISSPLPTPQATLQWKLGAWGTIPGWPAHVATFEQRKVYARTNAQPSGIWATKTGGYGAFLDFSTNVPVKDDDAISFTLTDVNEIQWIAEGSDLLIGTAGAARTMGRDSPNLAFSANNFRQALASSYGSEAIRPAKIGNSTVFVSSFGKSMREFVQGDSGVGYATPDISILSEHLLAPTIKELCYAQEPSSIVWFPNGDGELIGLTYEKDQSVAGFHHIQMGGNGVVESTGTIPGQGRHELWLIVNRTIGGVTKRYIERQMPEFDGETMSPADAWYMHCGLQTVGAPATGVTGLGHLEGLTVTILADGAKEANQVVTGGAVSLASGRPATKITVGLPYTSRAHLMPSPVSAGDGSGLGRRKKIVFAKVDFLNTGSLRVGRDEATAEEITLRLTSDNLGSAPPLYTGFHDARPETSWGDKGELLMIADGPLPATVRSITLNTDPEP